MFGFNASVSRFAYNRSPKNSAFDLTTIGWPASYNSVVPTQMRTPPTPCVANFADNIMCTQGQSYIQDRNTQYYLSPSMSMLRGHHQFHFGFQFEVGRDNYAQSNIASGAFDFCVAGQACFTSFPVFPGLVFPLQISCLDMLIISTTWKTISLHRLSFQHSPPANKYIRRSILKTPGTQPRGLHSIWDYVMTCRVPGPNVSTACLISIPRRQVT